MPYERMLDKSCRPSDGDILALIGEERAPLWHQAHAYMDEHYDCAPELAFWTKKYGWTVRYKKSGKTLCYFFPEAGAFSVLLVLGGKESAKAEERKESLSAPIRQIFEETEQLRDGRWLWLRILDAGDFESFTILLAAKRRPR